MRALTVRGPFRGATGNDHHVREFVRELARQGVCVRLLDLPLWSPRKLPFSLRDPWFETLRKPTGGKATRRLREILSEFDAPRKRFWPFSAAREKIAL